MKHKKSIMFCSFIIFLLASLNAQDTFNVNEYGTYLIKNGIIEKLPIDDHLMYPRPHLNYIMFHVTDKDTAWLYNMDNGIATSFVGFSSLNLNEDFFDEIYKDTIDGQRHLLFDRIRYSNKISYNTLRYYISDIYYINFIFDDTVDINGKYDPYFFWTIDKNIFILIVNDDRYC
jgi:hypothetical protein